ncbi:MAG: Spy/CpxP family protein refolding chaperone [Hyphomicrobiaceae bacterium]
MSDTDTTQPAPGQDGNNHSRHGRCGRPRRGRALAFVAGAALATGVGFFAGNASGHGFGIGGHHFGHGPGFTRIFAPATVDEAQDRARRGARHLAIEIDATGAQEEKLITLAKALAADVYPIREQMREARAKGLELLKAPVVDRAAIEALRSEQMAKLDAVTKRLTTAIGDAGEVLTPEQRVKLATRIEEFRDRRGWWRRHRDRD